MNIVCWPNLPDCLKNICGAHEQMLLFMTLLYITYFSKPDTELRYFAGVWHNTDLKENWCHQHITEKDLSIHRLQKS